MYVSICVIQMLVHVPVPIHLFQDFSQMFHDNVLSLHLSLTAPQERSQSCVFHL